MESFTHESDNSSSCTQSDGDSTNSSNGANPFLLCPRGDSLQSSNHGRLHADTDDIRPYKLARIEPSGHLRYRASALTNPQGVNNMPYAHGVIGGIHRPDGMCRSGMLPHGRSYTSSALEDCRGLPVEFARSQHAGLPYIGAAQNFFPQNQWPGLRQQNFAYKPIATGSTPASTLLLPLSCKVDQMPINFGSNSGVQCFIGAIWLNYCHAHWICFSNSMCQGVVLDNNMFILQLVGCANNLKNIFSAKFSYLNFL